MKSVQGILINPFKQSVTMIFVYANDLESIYAAIGARTFECVSLDNGDTVYVDEEGTFDGHCEDDQGRKLAFQIDGMTLMGKGLILGFDPETGDATDAESDLLDIYSNVTFGEIKFN